MDIRSRDWATWKAITKAWTSAWARERSWHFLCDHVALFPSGSAVLATHASPRVQASSMYMWAAPSGAAWSNIDGSSVPILLSKYIINCILIFSATRLIRFSTFLFLKGQYFVKNAIIATTLKSCVHHSGYFPVLSSCDRNRTQIMQTSIEGYTRVTDDHPCRNSNK